MVVWRSLLFAQLLLEHLRHELGVLSFALFSTKQTIAHHLAITVVVCSQQLKNNSLVCMYVQSCVRMYVAGKKY